eukprot:4828512-Pleurochrysis_carterae.AAC.1
MSSSAPHAMRTCPSFSLYRPSIPMWQVPAVSAADCFAASDSVATATELLILPLLMLHAYSEEVITACVSGVLQEEGRFEELGA